jgi:hypothetical protein
LKKVPSPWQADRGRVRWAPMADMTLEEIETNAQALDKAYEEGYSGKDRHSVNPEGLEQFLKQVDGLMAELAKIGALTGGDQAPVVLRSLTDRKSLYERELVLVRAARALGPNFEKFSAEGAAANFVFDRYNRYFAGQGRDTRDLGLLKELVEELRQIKKRMSAIGGKNLPSPLDKDLELVESSISRYQIEEREIPKAQLTGTTEEQANRWAFLANQQFALYQTFFAGQSRVSRRPQLLVRLVENLKRYRTAMFDLKSKGLKSASNDGNIGIVDGRIKAYEQELVEIRSVRKSVPLAEIMGVLGGAANELFQEYRDSFAGKDRTSVNLQQLAVLLDKLDELRRQMEELGRVEKNESNVKNQVIVREYQASWVREHQLVKAAQQGDGASLIRA